MDLVDIVKLDQLRLLAEPDANDYKALRDEMLSAYPSSFTSDAATERDRPATSYGARFGPESESFTLGAWDGGYLVGALTCKRDPRAKVRHVGELLGMMVRPEFQRQGVGQALLSGCLDRLRRTGNCDMLTLSVTANNLPAIHLYERNGFCPYGVLQDAVRVDGQSHSKTLMVVKLARVSESQ